MKVAIRGVKSPVVIPSTFRAVRSVLDRKIWIGSKNNTKINSFYGLQTKRYLFPFNFNRQQYQFFRSFSTENENKSRITPAVRAALQKFITKRDELAAIFDDPGATPSDKLKKYSVELGEVASIADNIQAWDTKKQELEAIRKSLRNEKDSDMQQLMKEDYEQIQTDMLALENDLINSLVPKDPADDRNCILELRAGAGGLEATLFASEMFAMYRLFAANKGWRWDTIKIDHSDLGGYKEASASVMGQGVYAVLKWESGVHRVQRVPETEAQGRTHTSTITVAVLPEPEDVDIKINPKDLRIDTYRSSGAGGQHVNTTESAVRITHIPTGLTVAIQDERSQHQNKDKAMKVLRSRLFELERERTAVARNQQRTSQIGSGERHERIRTYNFSQDRVTDHRCNTSVHDITGMMEGQRLEDFTEAMRAMEREKVLIEIK